MAYNGFAIDKYLNAAEVTRQLDELIKKPVYSVRPNKLKMYEEEYFEKKCSKSKAMRRSFPEAYSTIWLSITRSPSLLKRRKAPGSTTSTGTGTMTCCKQADPPFSEATCRKCGKRSSSF